MIECLLGLAPEFRRNHGDVVSVAALHFERFLGRADRGEMGACPNCKLSHVHECLLKIVRRGAAYMT